jgi:hypothetical protein
MDCGGGVRKRELVCAVFIQGVAVGSALNATDCVLVPDRDDSDSALGGNTGAHTGSDNGVYQHSSSSSVEAQRPPVDTDGDPTDGEKPLDNGNGSKPSAPGDVVAKHSQEGSCRDVPCLTSFLQVSFKLDAFYRDACFTVEAQQAFFEGFALEMAQALHITVDRIQDINAAPTERDNEMLMSFIVAPPTGTADQPIRVLQEQLVLQVNNVNSGLRARGTWTRLVLPESLKVAGSSYMPQSLNVRSITFDIIILLVTVGSCCLLCALWGAWISTRGTTRGRKFGHGSYGDLEDSGHSGTTAATTAGGAAAGAGGTADNSHDNSCSDYSDSSSEDGWEYDLDDVDIDGSDSGSEQQHSCSCACSRCCRRGGSAFDCGLSGRAKRASDAHQQQQAAAGAAAVGADDVPVATVHSDGITVVSSGGRSSSSSRQQQRTVVVETPLPGASKDGIHKRGIGTLKASHSRQALV